MYMKTQVVFFVFRFSFQAFLSFTYPMNALVYVNIDQDIYIVKLKNVQNEKKKLHEFSYTYIKCGKFCSISLEH